VVFMMFSKIIEWEAGKFPAIFSSVLAKLT
jgi:hypothetical protein